MAFLAPCNYNSSQPLIPYFAPKLQNYGMWAGGLFGSLLTTLFLLVKVNTPNPDPSNPLNSRRLTVEISLACLATPPTSGWLFGKIFGTFLDYAFFGAQHIFCADVTKSNNN